MAKRRMTKPLYGDFDCVPSRYNADEAWVFRGGDEGWEEINHASQDNAVREMSKEDFDYFFPDLPPLPPEAFRSSAK